MSTTTSTPIFTAGGLASGLDTNTIVDKLVALEQAPITKNTAYQAALTVQISAIGDLSSKIKALAASATSLGSGVSANTATQIPTGIGAVAGVGAVPGNYSIQVTSVASAARARSTTFNTANDTVAGGALNLHIQGVATTINIAANSDLGSVVKQINQSGSPISAAIVSDGTNLYVSLTNRSTGKPIGSGVDGGLTIDSDSTGLGLTVTKNATNAVVKVDDLTVESKTNDISTAIPGVTITAKSIMTSPSDLVVASDPTTSTSNLQAFVDKYNAIITALQPSLRPDPDNPPADGTTLDGSTVLGLEQSLHGLLSSMVVPSGTVRTLADIGVELQNDGTLNLNTTTFTKALAQDPNAVDSIFSTASTGLATKVGNLSTRYTSSIDGQLVQRTTSLQKTIKDITTSNARLQDHVDNYKLQLQREFATMESLIANYNSIGTFLTNSASAASGSSK
ncbi:MAG TPA: flagellar filament capping protein FliD [Polyangia bacterium]|jgi:flagellar hook-associated protein 2